VASDTKTTINEEFTDTLNRTQYGVNTTVDAGKLLIFLDIDGVMLPDCEAHHALSTQFPDACLESLCFILNRTGAELVLSSTWRCSIVLESRILQEFKRYSEEHPIKGAVLGRYSKFQYRTSHHESTRQWECVRFLQSASECLGMNIANWIALDDDTSFVTNDRYRDACRHRFVQTNPATGLTMNNAVYAVEMLLRRDGSDVIPDYVQVQRETTPNYGPTIAQSKAFAEFFRKHSN
jgi:hypothetical protein